MKPQLLPAMEPSHHLIDYTQGVITRQFTSGTSKYYFTLHPEYYPDDDALVPTGRYFAVMLTPKGVKAFYVLKDVFGNYVIDYDTDNEETPEKKLSRLNGFTTDFASALQKEILQQVKELKDYMNMINQALKEPTGA